MTTTHTDRTERPFAMDEATAILARTPATLDAMLRGLGDGWIAANEGVNTWSPFDVVGHLIHGERTDWMPRVRISQSTEATNDAKHCLDRSARSIGSLTCRGTASSYGRRTCRDNRSCGLP
jgi:hypothetical protein